MSETKELNNIFVIGVPGSLLLPGTSVKFSNLTEEEIARLDQDGVFAAVPLRTNTLQAQHEERFNTSGVLCRLIRTDKENGRLTVDAMTACRIKIEHFDFSGYPTCSCTIWQDEDDLNEHSHEQLLSFMKETVRELTVQFTGTKHWLKRMDEIQDLNELMCFLAQFMNLSWNERIELLEMSSLRARSIHFVDLLMRQKEEIQISLEMRSRQSEEANAAYRKEALKRQLRAIQEELNEEDDEDSENWEEKILACHMPEKVEKAFLKEASRLESSAPGMESEVIRNHLDFATSLPWQKEEARDIDLNAAKEILDSRHYGMDKVKERVIQHLAMMQLRHSMKGSALLLVGPPGTGKTSLGRSIAKAMNREYTRLSLGGVRDESEIRGHRRTYVGAMAGRILQTMKNAGTTNPVMILDEIDKLMQGGFAGDPAAAMLEVLDPEQNNTFTDHYLDQPYDLSDVFFIATANSLDTIPAPLLDRMEIIQISSYSGSEKFHIAKDYLIPEVVDDAGLEAERIVFEDDAIQTIVDNYTMEAGCRGLKKRIAQIVRMKAAELLASKEQIVIRKDELEDLLGSGRTHEKVKESNPAGVATGLAWTAVGGEVLFIETTTMPGSGQMIVTGQLGDVMKESARIALSVLKSRLPLDTLFLKNQDLHIHVPAGATPKDGPSAGITLFTALASLATGQAVDSHIAMTGELTLRGEVLPIGGLKEKLFGAMRAGITKVLIPWDNRSDLKEIPAEVKDALEIVPVHTVEDVLHETLGITLPMLNTLSTMPSHGLGSQSSICKGASQD